MFNRKSTILSLALIASLYSSTFCFTYADAVRVPNISIQERTQTDKLVAQLKALLAKYPTKASTVAARLQTLENRTSNAKNKRIYAKLREVAEGFTTTNDTVAYPKIQGQDATMKTTTNTNPVEKSPYVQQSTTTTNSSTGTSAQASQTTSGIPGREVGFEELKTIVGKYVEVDNTLQFTENGVKKQLTPRYISKISLTDKTRIFSTVNYKLSAIYKLNGEYYYANQYSVADVSGGIVASAGGTSTTSTSGTSTSGSTGSNGTSGISTGSPARTYTLNDLKTRVKAYYETNISDVGLQMAINGKNTILAPNGFMEFSPERDSDWIYRSSSLMGKQNFDFGNQAIYKTTDLSGNPRYYLTKNGYMLADNVYAWSDTSLYFKTGDDLYQTEAAAYNVLNRTYKNSNIESTVASIVQGTSSDEQKIDRIYQWITGNVSYDSDSLASGNTAGDPQSAIMTFVNRKGVCGGQSRLMLLMLELSNVRDAELIIGNINPAFVGPYSTLHAWVRVGTYYYDPTWGGKSWYKLPKDLMDARNTDTYPSSVPKEQYKTYYQQLLQNLAAKYKGQGYTLLSTAEILNDIGISVTSPLAAEQLATKLKPKVAVYLDNLDKGSWTFTENGVRKQFKQRKGIALLDFSTFIGQPLDTISQEALIYDKNSGSYFLTTGGFDIITLSN